MGFKTALLMIALVVATCAAPVRATGWDNDDFIITGAPNFPDRIGIFDHDFTFKGYLDQNFVGVQGMDFDARGRLVALSALNPEVRVYDPSGARVGGFAQTASPMLVPAGDLKVTPDGNYALGTSENGVRIFSPEGVFVRQYGDGSSPAIAFVPENKLWSGGRSTTVNVFDTDSGALVGTFPIEQQTRASGMQYSPMSNTVLVLDIDRDLGGVFERDLTGGLVRQFHVPVPQTGTNGVTRGPGGHVFGTTDDFFVDVVDWQPGGTVARTINVYPVQITAANILWAGIVPEPSGAIIVSASCLILLRRIPRKKRQTILG